MLHARQLALAGLLVAGHLFGGGVVHVGAEGRDLDHLVLAATAEHHVHDPEAPADDEGAPEQALDLLGRRAGGHVEILGAQAHQQVAHGTAHDVRLEDGLLERVHDVLRALVHERGVDAMLLRPDFLAFAETRFLAAFGLAQQLVDESFNHA